MKKSVKPFIAIASATILLPLLVAQPAQAQSILTAFGSSEMADVVEQTGSQGLNISWFVVEDSVSDVYTYAYTVSNPAGDTTTFNNFSLSFNTTVPGAYLSGSAPVGGTLANNGPVGLTWTFPAVAPGASTTTLVFDSSLTPTITGNASAGGGSIPPSPWSTYPAGQPVPIPRAIPEPEITSMFALAALLLLPFSSTWRRLVRKSWDSSL